MPEAIITIVDLERVLGFVHQYESLFEDKPDKADKSE